MAFFGMNSQITDDDVRVGADIMQNDPALANTILSGRAPFGMGDNDEYSKAQQLAADRDAAWSQMRDGDLGQLAMTFGLSMLANNRNRSFGELVGQAGFDTIGAWSNEKARRKAAADEEFKRQADAENIAYQRAQTAFANRRGILQDRIAQNADKRADLEYRLREKEYGLKSDKQNLDAWKTMQELERINQLRALDGLPPISMPGIGGGRSTAASGSTSGRSFGDLALNEANNNPGNIEAGNYGKAGIGGRYAGYDTTLDGFRALDRLIQDRYKGMNALQFAQTYAPKSAKDPKNDPEKYAAEIRAQLGIKNPDQILDVSDPKTREVMMRTIAKLEGPVDKYNLDEAAYAAGTAPVPSGYASRNIRERSKYWKAPNAESAPSSPAQAKTASTASGSAPFTVFGETATPEWVAKQKQYMRLDPDGKLGYRDVAKAKLERLAKLEDARVKNEQENMQYVDGIGMVNKRTGQVVPITDANGVPVQTPKQKKEANDLAKQERADEAKRASSERMSGSQIAAIDHAISLIDNGGFGGGFGVTGLTGRVGRYLPWQTDARDLEGEINTIKGGALIQNLQALKEASPTGASGMGALNQSEGDALRDALGSLDLMQGDAQIKRNLQNIKQLYTSLLLKWGYSPEDVQRIVANASAGNGSAFSGGGGGAGSGSDLPPGFVEVKGRK